MLVRLPELEVVLIQPAVTQLTATVPNALVRPKYAEEPCGRPYTTDKETRPSSARKAQESCSRPGLIHSTLGTRSQAPDHGGRYSPKVLNPRSTEFRSARVVEEGKQSLSREPAQARRLAFCHYWRSRFRPVLLQPVAPSRLEDVIVVWANIQGLGPQLAAHFHGCLMTASHRAMFREGILSFVYFV